MYDTQDAGPRACNFEYAECLHDDYVHVPRTPIVYNTSVSSRLNMRASRDARVLTQLQVKCAPLRSAFRDVAPV